MDLYRATEAKDSVQFRKGVWVLAWLTLLSAFQTSSCR